MRRLFHFSTVIAGCMLSSFAVCPPAFAQKPVIQGVVNAASYSGDVAPGSWIAIFGTNLAPAPESAASVPLPAQIGGVTVTVGGVAAPLNFVSDGQINAIVPFEVPLPSQDPKTVPVVVTTAAGASAPFNIYLLQNAPAIFTQNGQGTGAALVFDGNFKAVSEVGQSPIVLYAAGLGATNPTPASSAAGGSATAPYNTVKDSLSVFIGDAPARVDFAGLAPNLPGVYQLNVTPQGPVSNRLYLRENGAQSNVTSIPLAAGSNTQNVTGTITPLYPNKASAPITTSVLLTAADLSFSLDIAAGAKPFSVVGTGEAGSAIINIDTAKGTWQATYSAPNAASRTGSFSSSEFTPVYDFLGCQPATSEGGYTASPFPGNVIPFSRLDPGQESAAQSLPLPNSMLAGGANGVFTLSGTFTGTHIDSSTLGLPPGFGGWMQLPVSAGCPGSNRTASFHLYVDGKLIAWQDVGYSVNTQPEAAGPATYSFESIPFNQFNGTVCPSTCRITGSFTLAQPLAPNLKSATLSSAGIYGSPAAADFVPEAFSFTDGKTIFDNTTNNFILGQNVGFSFDTDASGNIKTYSFYIDQRPDDTLGVYYGGQGGNNLVYSTTTSYTAQVQASGSVGTWTVSSGGR
jgi:uncharacterized protein (TIGR03437 family)